MRLDVQVQCVAARLDMTLDFLAQVSTALARHRAMHDIMPLEQQLVPRLRVQALQHLQRSLQRSAIVLFHLLFLRLPLLGSQLRRLAAHVDGGDGGGGARLTSWSETQPNTGDLS